MFGPSEGRNVAFVDPSDSARSADRAVTHPGGGGRRARRADARYLTVFPGASREMIARWWGRPDDRGPRAEAGVDRLAQIDVEGVRGLVRREDLAALAATDPGEHVVLLPGFDPFTNELPRHVDAVLDERLHDRVHRTAGWVTPIVVVDGRVEQYDE